VSRAAWAEVDVGAIAHNVRILVAAAGPASLCAVVKADGYGHGAVEVAKLALEAGAERLGARDLAEAAALRAAGLKAPVQMLAPVLPGQAAEAVRLGVIPVLDSLEQARALARAAKRPLPVQVDLDFGLARWGVAPRELDAFLRKLLALRALRLDGLSAHLGYMPGKNAVEAEEKLGAFSRLAAPWKKRVPGLRLRAANSTVFTDFPHRRFDLACVGNLLYGINRSKIRPPLKSPWTFRARVLSVREVRKGASVGYASEYLAPRRMRLAAVAAGYADGLTMEPVERLINLGSKEYWGTFEGKRLPFVGRVGISHALLDATDCPGLKPGDAVTLPVRRTAARAPRVYL
jgi:alanine racemase